MSTTSWLVLAAVVVALVVVVACFGIRRRRKQQEQARLKEDRDYLDEYTEKFGNPYHAN